MAHQATSTDAPLAGRLRALRERAAASEALGAAWRAALWSRLAIVCVAAFAALSAGGEARFEAAAERYDQPALTQPLGGLGDVLVSPLARWDAVWFLSVADSGYKDADSPRAAFFPLYPLLSRAVGELAGGSRAAVLLASFAVSLGALVVALALLHRLTAIELGRRAAGPAVLLLCAFPASVFLGAPYSESLFLAASLGAFLAARTGHWAWAGVAAAAASGTRSAGVLVLLGLVLLYLYGPRSDRPGELAPPARGWLASLRPVHAVRADAAWLALAPLGLAAYAGYSAVAHGDPFAFSSAQALWGRDFAGPFVGAWDGLLAAVDGARQLASGSREPVYFAQAGGDPYRVAAVNLMLFGSLVFAVAACLGVLRRLPFAYGAYAVAALAVPLSFPVTPQPLMSLPRFLLVLFPIFMWMAAACEERRSTARVAAASAVLLGLFTTQFATWQFLA